MSLYTWFLLFLKNWGLCNSLRRFLNRLNPLCALNQLIGALALKYSSDMQLLNVLLLIYERLKLLTYLVLQLNILGIWVNYLSYQIYCFLIYLNWFLLNKSFNFILGLGLVLDRLNLIAININSTTLRRRRWGRIYKIIGGFNELSLRIRSHQLLLDLLIEDRFVMLSKLSSIQFLLLVRFFYQYFGGRSATIIGHLVKVIRIFVIFSA